MYDPPAKAAYFRIRQGDAWLEVRCAEGEPMKACADVVLQILDRSNASDESNDRDDRGFERRSNRSGDYDRQRW